MTALNLAAAAGLLLLPEAKAWWYTDDENRDKRVAAWVAGTIAVIALFILIAWLAKTHRRRVQLIELREFRPPPPPGVVGYDVSGISSLLVRGSVRSGILFGVCPLAVGFCSGCGYWARPSI